VHGSTDRLAVRGSVDHLVDTVEVIIGSVGHGHAEFANRSELDALTPAVLH
jgi:hypothetical protein